MKTISKKFKLSKDADGSGKINLTMELTLDCSEKTLHECILKDRIIAWSQLNRPKYKLGKLALKDGQTVKLTLTDKGLAEDPLEQSKQLFSGLSNEQKETYLKSLGVSNAEIKKLIDRAIIDIVAGK